MRISGVTSTPDAYRQSQFYAGTHLAHYHVAPQSKTTQDVQEIPFQQRLHKALNGETAMKTPSMKEREFKKLREEHASREEAFQRLMYQNGVNFSTEQQLTLLKQFSS